MRKDLNKSKRCKNAIQAEEEAKHKDFIKKAAQLELDAIDRIFFTPIEEIEGSRGCIIKK